MKMISATKDLIGGVYEQVCNSLHVFFLAGIYCISMYSPGQIK